MNTGTTRRSRRRAGRPLTVRGLFGRGRPQPVADERHERLITADEFSRLRSFG